MNRYRIRHSDDVARRAAEMEAAGVVRSRIAEDLGVSPSWLTRQFGRRQADKSRRYNRPIGPPAPNDPALVELRAMVASRRTGVREIRSGKSTRVVLIRREIAAAFKGMGLGPQAIANLIGLRSCTVSCMLRRGQ